MDSERVPVGYVRRAHGVRGAVIVAPLTDRPADRFVEGASFSTDEDPPRTLRVSSSTHHADGLLVSFGGIDDRDAASALRGVSLTIGRGERRLLENDEYWPEQLVGCTVVDERGEHLGTVTDVATGGSQDRLVIEGPGGRSVEVPFVVDLVPVVDLDNRRLVVTPPDGLF